MFMEDKQIYRLNMSIATGSRSHAPVVLLAVSAPVDRVERSDLVNDRLSHRHAKANARRDLYGLRLSSNSLEGPIDFVGRATQVQRIIHKRDRETANSGRIWKRRDRTNAVIS